MFAAKSLAEAGCSAHPLVAHWARKDPERQAAIDDPTCWAEFTPFTSHRDPAGLVIAY